LADTHVVLLLRRLDRAELPDELVISTVTLAELSAGPLLAQDERERATRQAALQEAATSFSTIAFDDAAARAFGHVAASLRTAGRKATARSFDAMIAATALAAGIPVVTCNPSDFEGMDDLRLIAVTYPG